MTDIGQLAQENFAKVLEDGPQARYDYNIWVEARDPEQGYVLLGGLGAMGCGSMWEKETESDKDRPGYAEAPIRSSVGGFGGPEPVGQEVTCARLLKNTVTGILTLRHPTDDTALKQCLHELEFMIAKVRKERGL